MMDTLRDLWRKDGSDRWLLLLWFAVGISTLAWAWWMWREWSQNPDLSHGFFALPLLWLLWRQYPRNEGIGLSGQSGGVTMAGGLVIGLGALAVMMLGMVYVVSLDWQSRPALFLVSVALAGLWLLAGFGGSRRGWWKLNWAQVVACLVILLSAPLPPATYSRLTFALQNNITGAVVHTLQWLGIPAARSGNIILLSHTSVGVEEACSGVRSLISCILTGLVISVLMLRGWGRRTALIVLSGGLALVMNFIRSLLLTLLANRGVDISGSWHDITGFAVLGVTSVLLVMLALWLEQSASEDDSVDDSARIHLPHAPWRWGKPYVGMSMLFVGLVWLLPVSIWWRTRPLGPEHYARPPDMEALLPKSFEGWHLMPDEDVHRFAGTLLTDHLVQRVYMENEEVKGTVPAVLTVYVAYWPAGRTSVSTVATHTPDACWPGSGWQMFGDRSISADTLSLGHGEMLDRAEYRYFENHGYPQNVWYWHLYGGEPIQPFNPRSWKELSAAVFREGVRSDSSQMFIRISSNLDWPELSKKKLLREILENLRPYGLPIRETGSS